MPRKWATVALICLMAWLYAATRPQAKEAEKEDSSRELETHVQIKGVHFQEFGESGLTVELWSSSGKYSRRGESLELEEVKVLVPSGSGQSKKTMELTGKRGNVQLEEKLVTVRGDVQVVTEDGYELQTDEASYSYETKEIEGSGPVKVIGPEGTTTGVGFHVWVEEKVVLVHRSVETILEPGAIQRAKEKLKE